MQTANSPEFVLPAPSPFLEGTQIQYAWDSTSLGALKKCPRYYQYTILEGWQAKDLSQHIIFGLQYHKALELYDIDLSLGKSYEEALRHAVQHCLESTWLRTEAEGKPWDSLDTKKNRETLVRSVVWYLEGYREDITKTLQLANGKPAVELSFRFDSGAECVPGVDYILSGHMDRLVDFGGDHFVMDRKTTGSTLSGYYFDQFNPDNQMSLYTLASRVVYDMPVSGVIIDAAQIAVGFTAFSRGITTRSAGQLDEWFSDALIWFRVAQRYAEAGHFPMNEASCNNYGGCAFRTVCRQDPSVRDAFLRTSFEKRIWNPLEER